MLIKLTNFRQLILFVSFLFSVICHSTVFYFLIYVFWFVFLVNITVSVQVFSTFFGTLLVLLSLVHGWRGLSHVLDDYTFNPLLRPIFLLLSNLIAFRLLAAVIF
jgi:succinate dehydrogenase hydrophobic anchor subunit